MSKFTKVRLIDDPRIAGYTNRTRGGVQTFYTGNDCRDWDRYRADGGGRKSNVEMHDKPCTIKIDPPAKGVYAELIDSQWWWVNGCPECNGENGDWLNGRCLEHDLCIECKTPRDEIKTSVWGHSKGFLCFPCNDRIESAEKKAALDAMPEEYDSCDTYNEDNIKCPFCHLEIEDTSEFHTSDCSSSHECDRCKNTFDIEEIHTTTWTTTKPDQ